MALLEELSAASYKGAPFLVNTVSTSGGRKTVMHQFPNSNIQNIEDLGLEPRVYRIGAIIAEPFYRQKRDRVLRALEEGGSGVLVHPFYGRIENIVARTFNLNEDLTHLGDTTIDIVFGPSDTDGRPTTLVNTVSQILASAGTVSSGIVSDIGEFFEVTNTFTGNFSSASDKLSSIGDALITNTRSVAATADKINDFSSLVDSFQSSINTLITDPAQLADTLQELFVEVPKLYESAIDQTSALSLFFGFGDDDVAINPTTAGLAERQQNNDVLNNSVKAFALSESYVSAAQIAFTTVQEIEDTADTLETAFQSIKSASGLGI